MITLKDDIAILIVEDDPGHARLLEIVLQEIGVENPTVKIDRGDKAMDYLGLSGAAAAPRPAPRLLVMLDLNLPGRSGFDILAALRAEGSGADAVVVVLSSSDDSLDRDRCLSLGCDAYIAKPPEEAELEAVLCRLGLAQ